MVRTDRRTERPAAPLSAAPFSTADGILSLGLLLAGLLLVLGACTSAGSRAGTGDVAFRLTWEGAADLDLQVEDPTGAKLTFLERRSDSGGILDVDCNSGTHRMCEQPIENVYWPDGTAPPGVYRVWVELFNPPPGVDSQEVAFTLEVLRGERVVERHDGVLVAVSAEERVTGGEPLAGPFEHVLPR